jgi:signal transduction histidine kinase/HAMP domain-containing protein
VWSRHLAYRAKQAGEKTPRLHQINIGPRLTLCFAFIVVVMLVGNAVALWQFHVVRGQTERLRGVDQTLIRVLQAHTNLMSFYEGLDALAHSEDTARLVSEAEPLRAALLEDGRHTINALSRLPAEVQPDPTLLPALEAIEAALPAQLDAITILARSADWDAVRLRLAIQIRQLESSMSALVENIDREVGAQQAEAVFNIEQAQRRILLIVPATALLTLLFAALLGVAITRSITQPLGQLMEASRALGRGDFQHRVSVTGNDELAHLGRAFNDTAGTLRQLYETLHTREAYLAEAQRLSHTGSFGWNLSVGELVWSDETFRIFDYSQTAKPALELVLQRTHPDDVALVQQLFEHVARGETDWDLEHRLLMPDGSVKYVRTVAHAASDSSGQLRYVGAVVDLTPTKRAEEALRQAQATLARVTRVTTLGEMTASIAHEINQPLAAATTDSNTCLRWLTREPPDVEEAREAALRSVKDVTRAADIIRRIRTLFKKGEPHREQVDINEVVREMIVLMREEVDRQSVSIRSELAADLPPAIADRVQVQQVLMNLMLNGVEAMKGATGELEIKSQQNDGGQLQVSVSDTGAGLTEQANQIFDPFFTTKPDGTGMGLAISRSIVESHGGRLWATPNAGRGATFHFTLPGESEATE